MHMIGLSNVAQLGACSIAIMLACPASAQSPQDDAGVRARYNDLLAVQLYAVGGGFIPLGINSAVTGIDRPSAQAIS
jgi:hypothetical protein